VQSDAAADAGIAHIIADAGRLDVIVHNAGRVGWPRAAPPP